MSNPVKNYSKEFEQFTSFNGTDYEIPHTVEELKAPTNQDGANNAFNQSSSNL